MQVVPADVEGAGLLDVSLETYSGMRVVEETLGPEQIRRYLQFMGEELSAPPTRAMPPLLRATDSLAVLPQGSSLRCTRCAKYIGKDRVDDALRSLITRSIGSGTPRPFPTSLDLYRELSDGDAGISILAARIRFEKNAFWELATERAIAKQTSADAWQVTLGVRARKVVVVTKRHREVEVAMDDWVEVGVSGEGESYMKTQRIRSGSADHYYDGAAQAHTLESTRRTC